jgi:hypothetical protein
LPLSWSSWEQRSSSPQCPTTRIRPAPRPEQPPLTPSQSVAYGSPPYRTRSAGSLVAGISPTHHPPLSPSSPVGFLHMESCAAPCCRAIRSHPEASRDTRQPAGPAPGSPRSEPPMTNPPPCHRCPTAALSNQATPPQTTLRNRSHSGSCPGSNPGPGDRAGSPGQVRLTPYRFRCSILLVGLARHRWRRLQGLLLSGDRVLRRPGAVSWRHCFCRRPGAARAFQCPAAARSRLRLPRKHAPARASAWGEHTGCPGSALQEVGSGRAPGSLHRGERALGVTGVRS